MSYRKSAEDYERVVIEHNFAQKVWKSAEGVQLPLRKGAITFLICTTIALTGYGVIALTPASPLEISITLGIFFTLLLLLNTNILTTLFRLWLAFRQYHDCIELNLNSNLTCSFLRDFKEIVFIADNQMLKGVGLFKVKKIPICLQGSKERLIRSLYDQQVPFFFSHLAAPLDPQDFFEIAPAEQECFTFGVEFGSDSEPAPPTQEPIKKYKIAPPQIQSAQWEARGGPWAGRLIIGSCRMLVRVQDTEMARMALYKQLITDLIKIRDLFQNEYPHTELEPLCGNELISALQRLITGSAQPTWHITGEELVHHYLQVPQIVRKSMSHHYPAEFITPTNAEFDIEIGRTFETEFQKAQTRTGLRRVDMQQGILVVGGTVDQRFQVNSKLVHQYVNQGGNYLVITKNPQWRRLLDLNGEACVLRLGDEIRLNPMDAEGENANLYAYLLTQVFAQTFNLSRGTYQELFDLISIGLLEDAPDLQNLARKINDVLINPHGHVNPELKTVHRFLINSVQGKLGEIFGSTTLPFKTILGHNRLNIVELDLKAQVPTQFTILCVLAKTLLTILCNPDLQCTVLVDFADELAPLDPQYYRARELEPYFSDWVHRFHENKVGLHLSWQYPSRYPPIILNSFQTVLAFKISALNNLNLMRDLLQLFDDRMVQSRNRHDNHQVEYLQTLPDDQLLLKRPDLQNTFPVQITPLEFAETHVWTTSELRYRLKLIFDWSELAEEPRTVLERDFGRDIAVVKAVLLLLSDYPELTTRAVLSALNADPAFDLELNSLEYLLQRLVSLNYLVRKEWGEGRRAYRSYALTEKGAQVYDDFLRDLASRNQNSSMQLGLWES